MTFSFQAFPCKFKQKSWFSIYSDKYVVIESGCIKVFKDESEYNEPIHGSVSLDLSYAEIEIDSKNKIISIQVDNNTYLLSFTDINICQNCYEILLSEIEKLKQLLPKELSDRSMSLISTTANSNPIKMDKLDSINPDDMLTVAYGGSIASKSPYSMNKLWSYDNTKNNDEKEELDQKYDNYLIPRTTSLRSNNSNSSLDEDKSWDEDGEQYNNKYKIYISASAIKSKYTGYYRFDDGIITVCNIIKQCDEKMILQCKLIGKKGSHLRFPFEVNFDDEKLCILNKKDIERSHKNTWKKWMISLNAKREYECEFDGKPFKHMINTISRHPQLLFTLKYDNYKTKLKYKKYDHIIQSLFCYLLSIKCKNHHSENDIIKMDCNCINGNLFTKYSYYLLMAILNDKYNKQNILLLLQNGKIDTF
eukprot:114951_1